MTALDAICRHCRFYVKCMEEELSKYDVEICDNYEPEVEFEVVQ